MILIDTSALFALADRADPNHHSAKSLLDQAGQNAEVLLTHNYVLLESFALIHRRLGLPAALKFARDSRQFELEWVGDEVHFEAVELLSTSRNRGIGLVDQISFLTMRKRAVTTAFAFDRDFVHEGFALYR